MYLTFGLLPFILAPLLFVFLRRFPSLMEVLDGLILTSVIGLFFLDIFPSQVSQFGLITLVFALLGFLGPFALERVSHELEKSTHLIMMVLIILGMALHGAMDGAVLAPSFTESSHSADHLAWAVILHRIPGGLFFWWFFLPKVRIRGALALMVFFCMATISGYLLSETFYHLMSNQIVGLFQAFVGGSILHVVFHGTSFVKVDRSKKMAYLPQTVGCLLGIAIVYYAISEMGSHHLPTENHVSSTGSAFLNILVESAPALILGYLCGGIFAVFAPQSSFKWLKKGSSLTQSLKGILVGLPIPICSCGVVPLYTSFIKRGLPISAGFSFLIATPELGLDAIFLSIPLLGTQLTLVRILAAILFALIIGLAMNFLFNRNPHWKRGFEDQVSDPVPKNLTLAQKWKNVWVEGFEEIFDKTMPWILLGILIAALLSPLLSMKEYLVMPYGLDVLVAALVGLPIYVCASGSTPLVAVLLAGGLSPGAGLAFLLAGPATNVTTFTVLQKLHHPKTALWFSMIAFLACVAIGTLVNLIPLELWVSPPINHHDHAIPVWKWGAVLFLTFVFISSLFRKGARSFMSEIIAEQIPTPSSKKRGNGHHNHDHHDHDHHHHHDHQDKDSRCKTC